MILSLVKRSPYIHIYNKTGELYMSRWWLLKERSWLPYAARVHFIALPDDDRHHHDHPYDYRSIILKGCYAERLLSGALTVVGKGQTVAHPAEHFHKIERISLGGVVTLFIYRYKKVNNPWGFLTVNKAGSVVKQHWTKYLPTDSYPAQYLKKRGQK